MRYATLPYLNASVLSHFLPEVDLRTERIDCHPSQALHWLESGRVDAAILPVVDFFESENLIRVENLGICANGPVESVLLYCHRPIHEVTRVQLDPASRTSNALTRILLRRHFGISHPIEFRHDIDRPEAQVIIADQALTHRLEGCCYDLAEEWKSLTGLGFVFAGWVCHKNHPDYRLIAHNLTRSLQLGQSNIDYLAQLYGNRLGLEPDFCSHYLEQCIKYRIDSSEMEGMALFRQWYSESAKPLLLY